MSFLIQKGRGKAKWRKGERTYGLNLQREMKQKSHGLGDAFRPSREIRKWSRVLPIKTPLPNEKRKRATKEIRGHQRYRERGVATCYPRLLRPSSLAVVYLFVNEEEVKGEKCSFSLLTA